MVFWFPSRPQRAAVLAASLLLLPVTVHAQSGRTQQRPDTAAVRRQIESRLGKGVTQADIIERLRASGMSRAQVRARLQQAGYDPGAADRYFDAMEGGDAPKGEPTGSFVDALSRIGLGSRADSAAADSLRAGQKGRKDLLSDSTHEAESDTLSTDEREVFGMRTFRRASTIFEPAEGPVDPGYRLGPGDEITLVLTGDVEEAYSLTVSREGLLFIPDVGQIVVNGLTLGDLEDQLYTRLQRVYSGVSRSAGATTRFHVSLGKLRSNNVIVTGDVQRPGSYQVSSASGLFNLLYQAGGPTREGSFRRVEVYRGGRLIQTADLYDYLVRGNAGSDVRLENNDRVFVAPAGAQVRIEGAVRRPMTYEIKPGESIRDLIAYAGGLSSDALVRRVQIDRIVPPEEQRPGFYRTLVDVGLDALSGSRPVPLRDGDVVTVSAVSDVRRHRVWAEGGVRSPGLYEWSNGMTLSALLDRAEGIEEDAYIDRAHVFRLVPANGTRTLLPVSLSRDQNGRLLDDIGLVDGDSVVVLRRSELRTDEEVRIDGFVKRPDSYALARGMTLRDLILAAGGFTDGANNLEAEIARLPNAQTRSDTTAYVLRVPLDSPAPGSTAAESWLPAGGDVPLAHGDRVVVRRAPGYEAPREIELMGEVARPGRYVLARRDERLSDVIKRAGGLTPQAFAAGMRIVRDGRVVAADLRNGLKHPGGRDDLRLMGGDSIQVPALDPTVKVTGAVLFDSRVLYVPGETLDYYIQQAGGYAANANSGRTTVTYAGGERAGTGRFLFFRSEPAVQPGAEIYVPERAQASGSVNWDQVLARASAVIGAVATAMFAISQMK